jgi:hypothetical protein
MIRVKNIHKLFGYSVIFTVQVAVCSGILMKGDTSDQEDSMSSSTLLVIWNVLGVVSILIIAEWRHRRFLSSEVLW